MRPNHYDRPMAPSEPTKLSSDRPLDFEGRLLAEALRGYEVGHSLDDHNAVAVARRDAGDLEQKIVMRARNLEVASALSEALRHVRTTTRITLALAGLLALAAGGATALTALQTPADTPINFHWALLSLLGVETLVLILWIAISLARPSGGSASTLGLALAALGRRVTGWLHRGQLQSAALQAAGSVLGRGAIGRWGLGAVTHGLWLAFLAGALAMTLLLLSAKQVSFAWQTTILSEESYLPLTEGLAVLPRLTGLPVPSRDEIRESRWTGSGPAPVAASRAWSGLLVGCLLLYGILPRGLLLLLCLTARSRAIGRFRLDLGLSDYQSLAAKLTPAARREGVVDGEDRPADLDQADAQLDAPIAFSGPVALLALEIEPPTADWPPHVPGINWHDLGAVDSREERDRACAEAVETKPGLVLVAVSLLTTPDRGVGAFLSRLHQSTAAPVALLLSDEQRLAARHNAGDAAQRVTDWRRLLAQAGRGWALAYDIAAPGETEQARLATLLGQGQGQTGS